MITKRIMKVLRGTGFLHIMVLIFILGFLVGAPPWAHADIPRYINYQGRLTDADGNPVTGDVSITIKIYNAETGGTTLWTETQTVTVTNGIFSILLGDTEALTSTSVAFDVPYWYSIEIESDGEMTPRQRLTAVAYAMNADKLDGYDASDFLTGTSDTEISGNLTVTGGVITAGANEDVEINPTGTGNIVMTIDSTSGDFKITDGTTNFVLVDNDTGNVTIANNLTVSGTISGTIASSGGDSTFSSITVTGTSDLQGNISDSGGALTIADALTQTGSSNQVTFAGNVDADAGLDVTGALTVSGATTLSSGLDLNANIDLDYSGTSAALDVDQQGAGAAAIFTGGKVIIGSGLSNAYALSAGELYVQGDMEVDGTIYGDLSISGSQTFADLTVTGTSDLQGDVTVGGTITAGSDSNVITTLLGMVDGSKLDFASPKIVLHAEYPTAVLKADTTNASGTLTASSNTDLIAPKWMNYYDWTASSSAALQGYNIIVRYTLPPDFASWATSDAIKIDFCTQEIAETNCNLDIDVYLDGASSADASSADNYSLVAGDWEPVSIENDDLGEWNAAGQIGVIVLHVQSQNSKYVRVGDITLNYNR